MRAVAECAILDIPPAAVVDQYRDFFTKRGIS